MLKHIKKKKYQLTRIHIKIFVLSETTQPFINSDQVKLITQEDVLAKDEKESSHAEYYAHKL